METQTSSPVILHVDLDCFYAAVEHVRLGIPSEKPLAVQQWEGLIAVNYAARAAGVVRHDRVADALRKCPDLQLVHVETIGNDKWDGAAARRDTAKVSLERYRQASRCVFDIFHQHADVCERASIDEAYLDVTKKVELLMKKGCDWNQELQRLAGTQHPLMDMDAKAGMVVEKGPIEVCDPVSRRLLAGAIMAEQIRTDVRSKLGYTCSVGIATNKLLAKIASARNKPDQQTLILPGAVADLMDVLPLKKVKLLGGKVGEELSEKWNCKSAGDAQKIPLRILLASFGDRLGNYLYKAVRGIHEDKVQEKQTTKSMLAAKSFQATNDLSVIRMWLGVLAEELSIRMLRDARENHRQPHNLQLYYRSGLSRQSGDHSKSCSMPHAVIQLLATSCFGTSRGSASKQQVNETIGLSMKCDKECNIEGVRKLQEEPECDKFLGVAQYVESDIDRETPSLKEESGFLDPEDKGTFTDDCWRNGNNDNGVEDETAKDLSKLLQQASFQLFQRVEDALPCTRLAIAASGFHDAPAQGSQSIQHFFGSALQGSKMPSLKPSVEGPVGEDTPINKRRGMLRYVESGIGCKKPQTTPYSGSEGLCCVRKDIEERLKTENPSDSASLGRESYRSMVVQCAIPLLEDGKVAVEPALEVSDSGGRCEDLEDEQGVPSEVDCSVDLNDINVDEQCRILEEICKARVASDVGNVSSHDKYGRSQEMQTTKRKKSRTSNSKSGQLSLSKYFRSSDA